jgi:hypothetical protein
VRTGILLHQFSKTFTSTVEMNSTTMVAKLFNILRRPSHLKLFFHDYFGYKYEIYPDSRHLKEAILWLCRAQDVVVNGGVSAGYHPPHGGWMPAYPETTGYIIPTFLRYGLLTGNRNFIQRAIQMGDWEIEVQLPSGGVSAGLVGNEVPRVFNTGQVILGWTALTRQTGEKRFLKAAEKAVRWLIENQDSDGKWSRHCHNNYPHTYHTRVAWPILEVYNFTKEKKMRESARKHLEWVISQALENGWCSYMAFTPEEKPLTHTIAYTIRGLIEASKHFWDDILFQASIMKVARSASENIMLAYERRKSSPEENPLALPATFDDKWLSHERYSCITGNAQLAIIWLKLFLLQGDGRFLNAALKILEMVKATQNLVSKNPGVRGGVPGCYPCWGKYNPFSFPNWATKFFADALILQDEIMGKLEKEIQ